MRYDHEDVERLAAQALVHFICELWDGCKATESGRDWFHEEVDPYTADDDTTELLFGDTSSWGSGIPFVVKVGGTTTAGMRAIEDDGKSYALGLDIRALVEGWAK